MISFYDCLKRLVDGLAGTKMWKTFNDRNAVEGMALTVRFGEPVNSLVAKRSMQALESAAIKEGFIDRQPLHHIQVDVSSQSVRQATANGIILQHNTVERNHFGEVAPFLSRQIILQPEQLVLQISKYRGWEIEWKAAREMFSVVLALTSAVVPVSAFRLEYLNRFIFDGNDSDAKVSEIIKESEFIADLGRNSGNLWHSHAGRFDDETDQSRRLTQINADFQVLMAAHPLAGRRTLALLLAVERQFLVSDTEFGELDVSGKIDEHFTALHDDIHVLFKSLVDSSFAASNGLPA